MATIGTFAKTGDEYTGEIVTPGVQAKKILIVPAEADPATTPHPPRVRGLGGHRGRLDQDLAVGPQAPRPQARRPKLRRAPLRQPRRGRGRHGAPADLVAPERTRRGLTLAPPAPPGTRQGGAQAQHGPGHTEYCRLVIRRSRPAAR
jgi:hypothetical protein